MNDDATELERFSRTGTLYRRSGEPVQQPFVARFLEPAMLVEVHRIHREVLRLVPEPGIVRADSDAFFATHFGGEGRILGAVSYTHLGVYKRQP